MTSRPTQVMVTVTTTAMAAVNRKFFQTTLIPRLSARAWWTEESIMWLKEVTHSTTSRARITARSAISLGATLRMSPMSRVLNLVKLCPPRVLRKMPSATAAEEKTLMAVSLAMRVFCRTRVNSRAMTTAKITAAQVGWLRPHRAPMAMPVKAECPRASEKKAIRLSTTIVDRRPNRGVMTSTASRAFFMKSMVPGAAHSKGRKDTSQYQKLMGPSLLPPPGSGGTQIETPGSPGPLSARPAAGWSAGAG